MRLTGKIKSWLSFGKVKTDAPLISVVLLLQNPIQLQDVDIHRAIINAWGRDVKEQSNEYVVNKAPICMVRFDGMILLLNNIAKPYVPEEFLQNAVSEFKELRQRKAVLEHSAWFSVDLMWPTNPKRRVKKNCYRRICRFAAEFVNDNCLGVSFPETGQFRPYDSKVKNALRSNHPLVEIKSWEDVPVIATAEDDDKLINAASEAKKRWPEFVDAFNQRKAEQLFSVKAPFRDGENVEWMWITVSKITEESVAGILGNAPLNLRNIHEGEPIRIPISIIGDWCYSEDNNLVGGFSIKALRHR